MKILFLFFSICWSIVLPGGIFAHPMGNFSINHYSELTVGKAGIQVRYILDFAEIPTFQERQEMDLNQDGSISQTEQKAYIDEKGKALADQLILQIDTERLPLRVLSHTLEFPEGAGGLPTMRLDIVYETLAQDISGKTKTEPLKLDYEDRNYLLRAGWKELVANAGTGMRREGSSLPEKGSALRQYPMTEHASFPQVLKTSFLVRGGGQLLGSPQNAVETNVPSTSRSEDAFTRLMNGRMPSGRNLFWVLFAALGLGAAHALSPGHGKTVVAAYLVGSEGTFFHALLLGLVVTFSHTAGVFLLGGVTLYLSDHIVPETLYPWLSRLSGLVILVIGLAVLRQRLRALSQDGHGHSHHHHHHDHHRHEHAHHAYSEKQSTGKRILALGFSGGIIPCPSALVVLLSAVAFHQVGFGLLLIVAFSLGLAATLTGVGLSVVYLGKAVKTSVRMAPVMRFLPTASAAGMAMLGGLIAFGGVATF